MTAGKKWLPEVSQSPVVHDRPETFVVYRFVPREKQLKRLRLAPATDLKALSVSL
jgi:hypothetical protein